MMLKAKLDFARRTSSSPSSRYQRNVIIAQAQPNSATLEAQPKPAAAVNVARKPADKAVKPYSMQQYQKHWQNVKSEQSYWIDSSDVVEGAIPKDLEGTFFRNGPGLVTLGGHQLHPFDGHGHIFRAAIKDGKVHMCNQFVKTKAYLEEKAADAILYRGFGTQKPGGLLANFGELRDKNVSNTSVWEWSPLSDQANHQTRQETGKLWALWEGDRSRIMDPVTLETKEEETLGGVVPAGHPMTAHPHYDPITDRLVTYGSFSRTGELSIWEINRESQVVQTRTHKFEQAPYIHDFILTKNYYIFFQAPIALNPPKLLEYLIGVGGQAKAARFDSSQPGYFHMIPRTGSGPVLKIETPSSFIWHYANAYEQEDGKVVVDACTFKSFDLGGFDMNKPESIPRGSLYRHILDPAAASSSSSSSSGAYSRESIWDWASDFPRINPLKGTRPHRFIYMAGAGTSYSTFPFQSILKADMKTRQHQIWTAEQGCFVGEPMFAPSTAVQGENSEGKDVDEEDEDKGYLVSLLFDGETNQSSLIILNAKEVSKGPICRIQLRNPMTFAFHNGWSNKAFQPQE